jgi:peptide-methionine (R)-S-oxide reductase
LAGIGTALAGLAAAMGPRRAAATEPAWNLSEAEWKKRLKPQVYDILRNHGTEYPFSSPLDHEKRAGVYYCAGCELALYSSKTKYDSGTGWPSFYRPLPGAVDTSVDRSIMEVRNEVHCHRCGGHLGHVFDDGPKPTGLRYCMNGLALDFKPGATA